MTEPVAKRRAPILDGRLSAAMELAEGCLRFADVGADHGRLSAALLLQNERREALITDVSPLALDKARKRIHALGLEGRSRFAVCDGLAALDGWKADTVFILGMGGDTIRGILERGAGRLGGAQLILSPQTEAPLVRCALETIGYRIRCERIAHDAGRDYLLIRACPMLVGEPAYTEEELLLGPMLLRELPHGWLPVLKRQERLLTGAIRAMRATMQPKDADRLPRFERELGYVQRALSRLEEAGKDGNP